MRKRESGLSLLRVAAAFALTAAACSSERLGGGTGGTGGDPCPLDLAGSASCAPGGGLVGGTGGTKGSGSAGGSSTDAGSLCDQIASKYQTALALASACTPGAANQCEVLVGNAPANCPGSTCIDEILVNDGSLVESERENWLNAGCGGPPQLCVDITCRLPPAVCVPDSPSAATGTCVPSTDADAGTGTAGPDGGESCEQLGADFEAAVSAAMTCTPGAPNQCQALADPVLEPCNTACRPLEPLNDATAVNVALMRWVSQCSGKVACPQILCQPPPAPTGICVRAGNDGGAGTCVAAASGTTN